MQTSEISSNLFKGAYGILPSTPATKTKSVSFSGNPLYKINLKKKKPNGEYETIPALFCQLIKNNRKDKKIIAKLRKSWRNETTYGNDISMGFLKYKSNRESYYFTEIIDPEKNPNKKITCIVKSTNPNQPKNKDVFMIEYLQSSPDIADVKNPPIKGSGELCLYSLIKIAKQYGFKEVRLSSTKYGFYEEMKFEVIKRYGKDGKIAAEYRLDASNFDSFIERVEKKYNLN